MTEAIQGEPATRILVVADDQLPGTLEVVRRAGMTFQISVPLEAEVMSVAAEGVA